MNRPRLPSLKDLAWLKDAKAYAERYNALAGDSAVPLLVEPARRQMATAFEILRRLKHAAPSMPSGALRQRGVLLADDVGLGKTIVGALIAGIFAGRGFRVRVLAPNAPMARRWLDEIRSHQAVLREHYGFRFEVSDRIRKLGTHRIAVSTQWRTVSRGRLSCDLLIVDEAHRAKNDGSLFAQELRRQSDQIGRVLTLTATPFSIAPAELGRMLELVGADSTVRKSIDRATAALGTLWKGAFADLGFGEGLVRACSEAIDSIRPYVIRHGVATLPAAEQQLFGTVEASELVTQNATDEQLETLIRADRALTLGKRTGAWHMVRTNDPRFHVGWSQLRKTVKLVLEKQRVSKEGDPLIRRHARKIRAQLDREGDHPKMVATGNEVLGIVGDGERVVLFCDHHETALELALHLGRRLHQEMPMRPAPPLPWSDAYRRACRFEADGAAERKALDGFLAWLSSDGMTAQIYSWLPGPVSSGRELAMLLRRACPREGAWPSGSTVTIAEELLHLWNRVRKSSSSRQLFAGRGEEVGGATLQAHRIVAVTQPPSELRDWKRAIFHPGSPDTILFLFNSPFGPDVLVVTDAFSEGFDLHRYCRHIVHYELDPSPMRTIQRNGRLRRVNCWAARTRRPLVIAYPVFKGTRDQRLVEIMKSRLTQFDLLLGGIGRDIEKEAGDDESRHRQETILKMARRRMRRAARKLSVVKGV